MSMWRNGRKEGKDGRRRERARTEVESREVEQNRWVDSLTETKEIKSDASLAGCNKRSGICLCDSADPSSARSLPGRHKEREAFIFQGSCVGRPTWIIEQDLWNVSREDAGVQLCRPDATVMNVQQIPTRLTWLYFICRAKTLWDIKFLQAWDINYL